MVALLAFKCLAAALEEIKVSSYWESKEYTKIVEPLAKLIFTLDSSECFFL